jgi:hypothetical protein
VRKLTVSALWVGVRNRGYIDDIFQGGHSMSKSTNFSAIFTRLTALLRPFTPPLLVEYDSTNNYLLNAVPSSKYPQGLFFGGVRQGKSYVSYYLMPVYMYPELLNEVSETLKKHMQGKSCFNFTALDEALFQELDTLTQTCVEHLRHEQCL